MKRLAICMAIAALTFIPNRSRAHGSLENVWTHETGADLLRQCEMVGRTDWDRNQFGEAAFCYGYLSSLKDTFTTLRQYGHTAPACVPDEVSPKQLATVVIQYLNTNPTKLPEHYNAVAILALKSAYPCGG